jgi:hypothetical protein
MLIVTISQENEEAPEPAIRNARIIKRVQSEPKPHETEEELEPVERNARVIKRVQSEPKPHETEEAPEPVEHNARVIKRVQGEPQRAQRVIIRSGIFMISEYFSFPYV